MFSLNLTYVEEVITAEDIIYQDLMHEDGLRACALYDYQAGTNQMLFIPNSHGYTRLITIGFYPQKKYLVGHRRAE